MTTPMSLKLYDKFSSISNKTMVAIFPNVCLWRRSYAQNWEVLTLKNRYSIEPPSYASTAYVVASSFLLFRKNLGNLREFFGQIVYPPPPLAKNCPYVYALNMSLRTLLQRKKSTHTHSPGCEIHCQYFQYFFSIYE